MTAAQLPLLMNHHTTPRDSSWFDKINASWEASFTIAISVVILLSSNLLAAVAISTHPQDTTVILGDRATFSVIASGTGALSYQWKKNGLAISGATSPSLTINPVAFMDASNYTVVIADSTPGTLTSNIAELMVNSVKGGDLDFSFGNGLTGAGSQFGNDVVVALRSDGKVVLGGNFSQVHGVARKGIARLNSDGSLDTSFGNGLSGVAHSSYNAPDVTAIALQSDGKAIIGGEFTAVNGINCGRVARLNSDGNVDTSFNASAGTMYQLRMLPDGRFLRGSQTGSAQISRHNTNGWTDASFGNGANGATAGGVRVTGDSEIVFSTAVQSDGKILIGGGFTQVSGINRGRIARLNSNGVLDTTFGNGLSGIGGATFPVIRTIITQGDGKIIIGGRFSSVNGATRNSLARLNSDGSLDTNFSTALVTAGGTLVNVLDAVLQGDGKIIIAGYFSTVNGTSRNCIARLHGDGTLDPTFADGMTGLGGSYIKSIALQSNGAVIIGGSFSSYNGKSRGSIARLLPSGANADLANITLGAATLSPAFSSGRISYATTVPSASSSITITPITSDSSATVKVNGVSVPSGSTSANVNLTTGANVITVAVTAQNGTTVKTYGVTVTRVNSPPIAMSAFTVINRAAGTVAFDGSGSTDADGSIVSYLWSWSGGSISGISATATLPPGVTEVTLSVLDNNGASGSESFSVDLTAEATFADADLEGAIRTALAKPAGPVTEADMATLTNLNLSGLGLTDLSGLETATNLRILNIRGNAFTDPAALWAVLDQLSLYCLYTDVPRPGGNPAGRITQSVTDTSGGAFFITIDAPDLPTLDISGLGIDTANSANITALQVFADAGVTIATGGTNLPPVARASYTVVNLLTGEVKLDGGGSNDLDGEIVGYSWTWVGGSTSGTTPISTVLLPLGQTDVTLTVTDNAGGSGSTQMAVVVPSPGPGELDPLDATIIGGLNPYSAIAVQSDGKIVIGGNFSSVLGVPRNNIARLNADGTLDLGFDPNADAEIESVTVQADGKILIGGRFNTLQPYGAATATTRNYLARLHEDGTLDTGFDPNPDARIHCVALQADGRILIGGGFHGLSPAPLGISVSRAFAARLNPNGTVDTSFQPKPDEDVYALVEQPNGDILIVGGFWVFVPWEGYTVPRKYIARVHSNGSLDMTFDPYLEFGGISCVILQPDGKILIGGYFETLQPNGAANPTTRNRIARLNADGTLDPGFDPNANNGVHSMALQADGRILVGGSFTALQPNGAASPISRNRIARLNADGTLDPGFDPNANASVRSMALQADGKVLLMGAFTALQPNGATNPHPRNSFARLLNDPATQSLSAPDATQVTWTRGGSSPAVSQVTFENSTDGGAIWSRLGPAIRVGNSSNWQLTGLTLPANGQLRARGRTLTGGGFGDGTGMVEAIASYSGFLPNVQFADANLEVAIRAALGIPIAPITVADMQSLTNPLDFKNLGITNLSGLEFATNLRILNVRGNPFADATATWAILDGLGLYCLYSDLPRPGGNSPGLVTQSLTDTSGGTFYIVVDASNLPVLNISGLGVDTSNSANIAALQVFADAGVTVETGGINLPPLARAKATVINHPTGTAALNGGTSSDVDGTVVSWAWAWPGGSASGVNPTVTLPLGNTSVSLTVTDDDGASSSTNVVVSVITLASAIQDSGLTGNDALPAATPFNDGVPNLLKYAFNMNLAGPDVSNLPPGSGTSGLPSITVPDNAPLGTLRVEFIRRKGSGLIYIPQKSTTLGGLGWSPLSAVPVVTSIDDQWERVTYDEPPAPIPAPACFGRVAVSLPGGADFLITNYGAAAGGGDDLAAIQAALAAADAGDRVVIPSGSFQISSAIVPKADVAIVGAGKDLSVIEFTGSTPGPMIRIQNGGRDRVELSGFTLDGWGTSLATQGIEASGVAGLHIHGIRVRNLVNTSGFGPHGIYASGGVTDSLIEDNEFIDIGVASIWGAGIRLNGGSHRNEVRENFIKNVGRGGILLSASTDCQIRGNTVLQSGQTGPGLGIELWGGSHRGIVEDNDIDHWLSIDTSNEVAVCGNTVAATDGSLQLIGLELAGGSDCIFTRNVVGRGNHIGLSFSGNTSKRRTYLAGNEFSLSETWGAQLQDDQGEIRQIYFYDSVFKQAIGAAPNLYGAPTVGFRFNAVNNGAGIRQLVFDGNRFIDNDQHAIALYGHLATQGIDQLSFVGTPSPTTAGTRSRTPAACLTSSGRELASAATATMARRQAPDSLATPSRP